MAEPDKRQIGDGSDNYGEAAKQMAKAAKEAGKETAKQAAVKGAEAGANAAAAAKIKRQVMLLTEGFKVFRHLQALGLESFEVFLSQFLHCYSPSSAENAVSKEGIFLNVPERSPTSVPTPYET